MNVASLVESISAGATAAIVVGTTMRRYWTNREQRQQANFRRAVEAIIGESMAQLADRQRLAEIRQGRHLDKQDREIRNLRKMIEQRMVPRSD